MIQHLDPKQHDFLNSPAVRKLLAALPVGSTRFVGGCVRNALLGEAVADIDLATTLPPEDVSALLRAAKISVYPTGIAHGTVTAVCNGKVFEITTLRKDVSTDGRRATVAFTADWAEDGQRRDFTMNALYADASGQIFDPTGRGLADAADRRLRFVGDAEMRVQEDYLRILRFFRFSAWYAGDAPMDKAALGACRQHKAGLKTLSAERIWSEVKKILSAPDPWRAVNVMGISDILEVIMPEASNVEGLKRIITVERREGFQPDPLLRLMAMAARDEMGMARLCSRMKMSNAEKSRLMAWAGDQEQLDPQADQRAHYAAIYGAGNQAVMDRAKVRAAGEDDPILSNHWIALARLAEAWTPPEFPLTGQDLIAAGVEPGPKMGKAKKALEALWVRSGFTADKARLLQALKLFGG